MELISDFRNNWRTNSPISLDGTPVEIIYCFHFLGLQISDNLAWTHNKGVMLKKAHQHLYPLRCLRKCGISTRWLMNFYHGTIKSILSGGVTVWYGNTTAQDTKAIQRVIRTAEKIIWCALPSIEEIFRSRCLRKACSIIQDHNHPGQHLSPPSYVRLPVPQHSNQDKQVQEQFLSTGSVPTELLIAQFVDFFWVIGLLDSYHTFWSMVIRLIWSLVTRLGVMWAGWPGWSLVTRLGVMWAGGQLQPVAKTPAFRLSILNNTQHLFQYQQEKHPSTQNRRMLF